MIKVTRLNGSQLYINADMICFVEATPDTVVSLANSEKVVVRESPEELVAAIVAYQRQVHAPLWQGSRAKPAPLSPAACSGQAHAQSTRSTSENNNFPKERGTS